MRYAVLDWPESQEVMENPRALFIESVGNATYAVPDTDGEYTLLEWPESQWFLGRPDALTVGTGVLVPSHVVRLAHLLQAPSGGNRLVDESGDEVRVEDEALLFSDGIRFKMDDIVAVSTGAEGYEVQTYDGEIRRVFVIMQLATPPFGPY